MIKSIDTPLTVLQTASPSLEDAYLEIVTRAEGLTEGPTEGPTDGG